jgi:hypothetical protein
MSLIKQSVIFPLNEYLELIPGTPFPKANDKVSGSMSTSGFVNVMDYGAKGDGKTNDDNAFKKAISDIVAKQKIGLLIPEGKTFLVSSVINQQLQHDISIFAYGATIKKADLSGYGWLQMRGKQGAKAIWSGGTIDGNQQFQQWYGNPTGGRYNGNMLGHNCLLAGVGFDFFFTKDVNFKNIVMDGVRGEDNTLAIVSNCAFDNSATFHYNTETGTNGKRENGAGDQGSASKFRVTKDNCHFYLLDSTFVTGSIGHQSSFPQNLHGNNGSVPDNIVTFIGNCIFKNETQDVIHIEDSSKAIFYKVVTDCDDDGKFYQPRVWISNSTTVFYAQDCNFNNTVFNINRGNMKLAVINGGTISSSMNYSKTSVRGNLDIIANTIIKNTHVQAVNSVNCNVQNGGIDGAKNSDKEILNSAIDLLDGNGNKLGSLGIVASPTPVPTPTPVPVPDPIPTPTPQPVPLPGAFTASAGIAINWSPASGATAYDINRCAVTESIFVPVAQNITGNSYNDTTALANTSYYYRIAAKNATGETDSNIIVVGAEPEVPVTPTPTPVPTPTPEPEPTPDPVDPEPTPVPTPATQMQIGMFPYTKAQEFKISIARIQVLLKDGGNDYGARTIAKNKDLKFIPSMCWDKKVFPTDLVAYERNAKTFIEGLDPKQIYGLVVENEPNYGEKNGSFDTYINMLRIVAPYAKAKGIDVYVGGLTYNALTALCYQLYLKEGDNTSANVFKNSHQTQGNQESMDFLNQYFAHVEQEGLAINMNFHCNVDASRLTTLPLVMKKLRQIVKGKLIWGECSFSVKSPDLVKQVLTYSKDYLDAVILYSEEFSGTTAVSFDSNMGNEVKGFIV